MAHRFEPHVAVRVGEKNADPDKPADHALGRPRGGFGTKIHLLCDADGNPLHFHLSPGQAHDSTMLDTALEGTDAELHDEDGVALARPLKRAGDKGCRAN
ncbi:MAG: transposase [Myxococcales bacterium]|nr:transposase [Myxococcales bacterium]